MGSSSSKKSHTSSKKNSNNYTSSPLYAPSNISLQPIPGSKSQRFTSNIISHSPKPKSLRPFINKTLNASSKPKSHNPPSHRTFYASNMKYIKSTDFCPILIYKGGLDTIIDVE